jgi:RHS repeat-associated protein
VAEYGGTTALTGTVHLVQDHLGNVRLLEGENGVVRRYDYKPFGEALVAGVNGRATTDGYESSEALSELTTRFTGKERDAETGLDYFGARYFSGAQERFTSPDPVDHPSKSSFGYDGFLAEPQRWNLYAYALNNPLRYIDENGAEAASIPLGGNRYLVGGQIITVPQRSFREQIAIAAAPAVGLAAAIFAPEAGIAGLVRFGPAIYNALTRFSNSQSGQELTQSAIETVTNSQAPNLATPTPSGAVKGAYEIALEGGRHAGFLRNYLGKSAAELERGIGSLERQIATHLDKIKSPGKYIEGFDKLDPRQQRALVNEKWLSDVQRQREQLEILKRLRKQQQ